MKSKSEVQIVNQNQIYICFVTRMQTNFISYLPSIWGGGFCFYKCCGRRGMKDLVFGILKDSTPLD